MKPIDQVLSEHEAEWMALPQVIGVGVGVSEQGGRPCLLVLASAPHESHQTIPATVEGYEVKIDIVGNVMVDDPTPFPSP